MKNFSVKMWSKDLALWLVCVIALSGCRDKVQNAPDRYNYQKALEAMGDNNAEEGAEFCLKDLSENPDDARTLSLLALAYHCMNQDGEAMEALNKSIEKWSGKVGEDVVNPYYLRAEVLLELEDTIKALEDFEHALRIIDNKSKIRARQMQIYLLLEDLDMVKNVAQKAIRENPNDDKSYYYLGLVAFKEDQWDKVLEYSDMIVKLSKEDLAYAQYLRAHTSLGMGKYEEAANYIIELLQTEDFHDSGFTLMLGMADSTNQFEAIKTRLEIQVEKEPNESYWQYCLGVIHEQRNMFASAIEYYKNAIELSADAATYERIMHCYSFIGDYKNALRYADKALSIDNESLNVLRVKSELLMIDGQSKESLNCADELVALAPENALVYVNRGDLHQYAGQLDEAIKDYGKSLAIESENSYVRIQRGKLLKKQGLETKANVDFKKVLKTDSVPNDESLAQYAYYYMNDYKKAKKHMANILKNDSTAGTLYDAACLYSLMNDTTKAMGFLKKAMLRGYRDFRNMTMDSDLDNIRNLGSFKSLMEEYMKKGVEAELTVEKDDTENAKVTAEVPFTREGGVCKVKCKINGLPLHFIFDTGASDVSLSQVEANFMMKNGYLNKKDVIGNQHYMDANGNVTVGTVINIKNVNFGGVDLNNIRASVVSNQKAPLLLGQSVLSKLGRVEIDNKKNVIKVNK